MKILTNISDLRMQKEQAEKCGKFLILRYDTKNRKKPALMIWKDEDGIRPFKRYYCNNEKQREMIINKYRNK